MNDVPNLKDFDARLRPAGWGEAGFARDAAWTSPQVLEVPADRREAGHIIVAGLLMHAVHLGGSHYTQYLGMSAGITAVLASWVGLTVVESREKRLAAGKPPA